MSDDWLDRIEESALALALARLDGVPGVVIGSRDLRRLIDAAHQLRLAMHWGREACADVTLKRAQAEHAWQRGYQSGREDLERWLERVER